MIFSIVGQRVDCPVACTHPETVMCPAGNAQRDAYQHKAAELSLTNTCDSKNIGVEWSIFWNPWDYMLLIIRELPVQIPDPVW